MSTFSHQKSLPPLPLPDLNVTLDKYLKSVEVFLSVSEFQKTRETVEKFRHGKLAHQLQNILVHRAANHRNWLDEWWYDAYNEVRLPLTPYSNQAATSDLWAPNERAWLYRAADFIHHVMQFWISIRKGQHPVTKSRGVIWDMAQYHFIFNSTRIPALPKDKVERHFFTEQEGDCPSHIIVLCRGNIWKVEMIEKDGNVFSADVMLAQLKYIEKHSTSTRHCVATLTTDHRDKWAEVRLRLITCSENNAKNLADIEKSVFIVAFTDEKFETQDQLLEYVLSGNCQFQWSDKCINLGFHRDGRINSQAEHANADAIALIDMLNTTIKRSRSDSWQEEEVTITPPKKLEFDIDDEIRETIDHCAQAFQKLKSSVAVKTIYFREYGNAYLKTKHIYGDTVVQMALQLAFYRTHHRLAPAYETASTRRFYLGRTETVRSCTMPLRKLVEEIVLSVDSGQDGDANRVEGLKSMFSDAYHFHNQLMSEARNGFGCDRHLLGLKKAFDLLRDNASSMNGVLIHLFTDPGWKRSGGDGNFLLSTSFLGYESGGFYGYVCPMSIDGYSTFYRILPNEIVVTMAAFRASSESDIKLFGENLVWALKTIALFFPSP